MLNAYSVVKKAYTNNKSEIELFIIAKILGAKNSSMTIVITYQKHQYQNTTG